VFPTGQPSSNHTIVNRYNKSRQTIPHPFGTTATSAIQHRFFEGKHTHIDTQRQTHLLGLPDRTTDKDDRPRLFVEFEPGDDALSLLAAGHGKVAIHDTELGRRAPVVGGVLEHARDGKDGAFGVAQNGVVRVARRGVLPEEDLTELELVGGCRHVDPEDLLRHHALEQLVGEHGQGDADEWFFVLVQGGW
jgi:hypothetical protein